MEWSIYLLKNPRTREVRYVGWTTHPAKRLKQHIYESTKSRKTYKEKWVFSLVCIGLHPVMEIVESGIGHGWAKAEMRWIAHYRNIGARLVNGTLGGDGVIGGWGTPEQRSAAAKLQAARKTPQEHKEWSLRMHALIDPEERRLASKKAMDARTPEIKRRYAEIGTAVLQEINAKVTTEQRSQRAKAVRERKTPEERSAWMKKIKARMTPEQRTVAGKKSQENHTPEYRSARARHAALHQTGESRRNCMDHEKRTISAKKAWVTRRANLIARM